METEISPETDASHEARQRNLPSDGELVLRTFQPGDEIAFRQLNEAWIRRYFRLEESDLQVLLDPRRQILDRGGEICLAVLAGQTVGCCALLPIGPHEFELVKMAVSEELRGHGIGRRMLRFAIECGWRIGARRLYLESNSALPSALHLYEEAGFQHLPPAKRKPSKYQRADVFMEMFLEPLSGRAPEKA
jgi:putative acetyltransferase